jgi:hypothetical protein
VTTRRRGLEKRIGELQEERRVLSRKVANRLLGVRRYAVARETSSRKCPDGWKILHIFDSMGEAEWFAAHRPKGFQYLIQEILE